VPEGAVVAPGVEDVLAVGVPVDLCGMRLVGGSVREIDGDWLSWEGTKGKRAVRNNLRRA
jgi:hypothetical protein